VWKGQDLGVLATLGASAVVVLLWIPFRGDGRVRGLPLAFIAVSCAAWLVGLLRIQADDSLFTEGVVAVPVILVALALKRPSSRDLRIALLVLAYGLSLASVLSIPLGRLGWIPDGFEGVDSALCRLSFLCDLTGGLPRWAGPFGSVNYAAPIGAFLVVVGLMFRRGNRWLLCVSGILVLVLSQGRTALFALLVALLILFLGSSQIRHRAHARLITWVTIVAFGVLTVIYIVVVDPTLNGRTAIWGSFLQLWRTSPMTGVGDSGVTTFLTDSGTSVTVNHAHSVFIDLLIRSGIVPTVLGVCALLLAVLATARVLRARGPAPLALVAFVIAAGLTETTYGWIYWSVYSAAVTWAVLSSATRADAPSLKAASLS
jgi:hypothetical protein